jgi:hypothetical protein
MTSEGTVHGRMTCGHCGHVADDVTLLTHCYKCGHYPLIIGKNRLCAGCKGLACEWPQQNTGTSCGCCKRVCRQRQTRAEEGIASDLRPLPPSRWGDVAGTTFGDNSWGPTPGSTVW